MSLLDELKRRNVFRVGIAYLVGSWLILQLAEVLTELLSLPSSIGPIVVGAVVIGFPVVLILAWVYEITPEGIKPESEVDRSQSIAPKTGKKLNVIIIAMLIAALAYFIWESRFADRSAVDPQSVASNESESNDTSADDRQSIAVLPFENRSRLVDDEFFVDGVHDDLLTNLARIGGLKVISRTSVSKYQQTEKSIPEIAAELGVATVMEGAVQRSGDMVRINVQLIDASTDEHLWAQIFDRQLNTENLFAIQTEISEQIAGALKTTLTQAEEQRISDRPTDNLEAYNAYLRGRQLMPRRNAEALEAARKQFELAVELDPNFARAWGSLALAAVLEFNYGSSAWQVAQEIMTTASDRALELDPNVADAWLIRAVLKERQGQYIEAENDYLMALEVEPNNALVHHWYANYLDDSSARLGEAFEHALRATELDPLSSIDQLELGDVYQKLGRFDEAERHIQQVLDRDPEFSTAFQYMGLLKEETGRYDEQLYWSRQSQKYNPGNPRLLIDEAWARMNMDDGAGMKALRDRIEAIDPNNQFTIIFEAFIAYYEGRLEAALETLLAVEKRGGPPFIYEVIGFINLYMGDHDEARAALEKFDPRLWHRETQDGAFKESPRKGCLMAWLMAQTGDEAMGVALTGKIIRYYEDELPNYLNHPERFDVSVCYLNEGSYEKAVETTLGWLNNGFWTGWWRWQNNPLIQPLLDDPRIQDAVVRMKADLATQRENVRRMETAGEI